MSVFCSGLLAKKAVEAGLMVKPYIRTSLVPGSGTVTHYLNTSGVLPYLRKLGYTQNMYTHSHVAKLLLTDVIIIVDICAPT